MHRITASFGEPGVPLSSGRDRCAVILDDGLATLTLQRPEKLNALDAEMAHSFAVALAAVQGARVVVLTGSDTVFSVGWDLAGGDRDGAPSWSALVDQLATLACPTIAAIEGYCLGAGLALAAACDFRVAGATSRLGLPETQRGTFAGMGCSWRLPALIGPARTKRLMLLEDVIDAQIAASWGLVDRVAPAHEALLSAGAWAARLAAGPPVAQATAKRLVDQAAHRLATAGRDAERRAAKEADDAEHREGVAAFLEKRAPRFGSTDTASP